MILTIKGADFSGSGLGTNTSVSISYKGNVTGTPGFIEKNTALTSTITIKTGYTYDSISSVTVGGSAISGYTATDNENGTVTLTIPANLITGKVVVNVNTTAVSTGGGTGGDSEGDSEQPGTGGDSGSIIYPEGTDVPNMMPQVDGYNTSTSGHIMEYSGYNWEEYDIYVSCRFGTTEAMYAACVWDKNDTYLGGIWKSTGTATVFTEELLEESDLPSGVTWSEVGKIGLSWSEGRNTPAMKLVKK